MLENLYNRIKIGGKLTHAHSVIVLKDLIRRVEKLENANEVSVSGSKPSSTSKKKATGKRVSRKSDDDS